MPQRLLSLSQAIAGHREGYWDRLEDTRKGNGDVTGWLAWFVDAYDRSVRDAEAVIGGVLRRTKMLDQVRQAGVAPCQEAVLVRILETEWKGFMTSPKWAKLTGCSKPTAQRDIADLVAKGLPAANPGGSRNSSYRLAGQWEGDSSRATALPSLRAGIELPPGEGAGRQAPRSLGRCVGNVETSSRYSRR